MSASWGDAKSWETADDRRNSDLDRDGYAILPGAVPADAVHAALRVIGLGIRRHGLPGGQEHADRQGGTFLPELRDDPAIWALADAAETAAPTIPLMGCEGDSWAEPQILLRFPDHDWREILPDDPLTKGPRPALVPHVDEEPSWAGHTFLELTSPREWAGLCGAGHGMGWSCGKPVFDPIHQRRRYRAIVGVALTDHGPDDGALHVWPGSHLLQRDTVQGSNALARRAPVPVPLKAGDAVVMHPRLAHASLNLGHTVRTMVYFRLLGGS